VPGVTNDDPLVPRACEGEPALAFDLPGLLVGAAEYDEGPTGCTVLLLPEGSGVAADQRGGAVGFTGDYGAAHAICLAGGSLLGLEAVSGVAAELHAAAGHPTHWTRLPLVTGAIIYDYDGRGRTSVYPDRALGRAAVRSARPGWFPLGARGAGRRAGVGQGAAARREGDVTVFACSVVNALGALVGRDGLVVHSGNRPGPPGGGRRTVAEELARRLPGASPTNTTLTVVVTTARLNGYELRQVGRQVHTSMGRAIQPFHTVNDGDVLWMVSTRTGPEVDATGLGVLASETAWDAVLASAR
jgi:L-aminopeptidase/D-esterase-like protein